MTDWNLVGTGAGSTLDVAGTLNDAQKVITAWKWIPTESRWAFYSPNLADGGAAYAQGKGYDFLTTINPGEGFWVNARVPFDLPLPASAAVRSVSYQTI